MSPAPDTKRGRVRHRVAGSVQSCATSLELLVPLVYIVVLSFSFSDRLFPLDDAQELSFVRNLESVSSLFRSDVFGLFRPLKNILFLAFDHMLPVVGVRGCRSIGIAIGVLSFFPVLALCRRVLGNEAKALAAASIWLLSPTLVSSAAWLSCANVQMMVSLSALSVVFHDATWNDGRCRPSRVLLAGALLFLSLVSYECAIATLPILLLFDFLLRPGRTGNREAWWAYAFYAAIVVAYLTIRHSFNASTKVNGSFANVERWQIVVSSPFFTGEHFLSWFWPFGRFTVLGSYRWGDAPWIVLVLCTAVFVSALAFAIAKRKQFPVLSFCILHSIFAFAPVSNCLGLRNGPYGDYYLSLASVGLAVGCAELCSIFLRAKGSSRLFAFAAVALFASIRLFAIPEAARWASMWSQGILAFEQSVRNYPRYFSNKQMLATLLFDAGRFEESLDFARQVEEDVGSDSYQMENVYIVRLLYALRVERNADAAFREIENCRRASMGGKRIALLRFYRGCVFDDLKGDEETAEKEYELALSGRWDVDSVPCADRLARLKAIHGERDEAIALWEKALKLDPDNAAVRWNLSVARRQKQDK